MSKRKTFAPHPLSNLAGNPPVGFGITDGLYCLSHPLHPPFGIGEGAVSLGGGYSG
jgi:hypothetical protein